MTLQSPPIRTFNPVYRCGAGKARCTRRSARIFACFRRKKAKSLVFPPQKCYAVYILPFYSGRKKEKTKEVRPSGERRPSRGKETVYEKEKDAARSVPCARGTDRRRLPAVRLRRKEARGAVGRGDHSGLSLEHHAVRKLRPLYPVAAAGREHRVHRRQQ